MVYVFIYNASNDFQSSYFEFILFFLCGFVPLRESKSYIRVTKTLNSTPTISITKLKQLEIGIVCVNKFC